MTHPQAALVMVLVTLLWSMAGIVSRQLESAAGFEVTFWRSAFNAAALMLILSWWKGPAVLLRRLREGGALLWLSGVCWAVMFTAFMTALTLTTVANVLVPMAVAPLVAALVARAALGHRLPAKTWAAIAVAGAGIGIMVGPELGAAEARHLWGIAIAFAVPVAGAINWTLIQSRSRLPQGAAPTDDAAHDLGMLPAILIGAVLSALAVAPSAAPWAATPTDVAWLALLGVFQLAVPCLLAVQAARVLPAPEVALLSLLEVVFGVAWAWWGTSEEPTLHAAAGALLVLLAMVFNEAGRFRAGVVRATS